MGRGSGAGFSVWGMGSRVHYAYVQTCVYVYIYIRNVLHVYPELDEIKRACANASIYIYLQAEIVTLEVS